MTITVPASIVGAALIVGGSLLWSAAIVGQSIRCAGFLSSNSSAVETVAALWFRDGAAKEAGPREKNERLMLAGARASGCSFDLKSASRP